MSDVLQIYKGSDGEATKALYARLETRGPSGVIAINLFRACKASERAKVYRGGARGRGSYRSMAYDKKQWSMDNLCLALVNMPAHLRWGWGVDDALQARGDPHHHVLYVDLPTGQVSFHTSVRGAGPDYAAEWDGMPGQSAGRICAWVEKLLAQEAAMTDAPIPIRPKQTAADSRSALYVDDEELRRRINPKMGKDRFRATVLEAEKRGFPRIRAVWGGRYWPKCKEWLDIDNQVGNHESATAIEDGPEQFDASAQRDARAETRPSSVAVLDRQAGRARPHGVSGSVHRAAGRR